MNLLVPVLVFLTNLEVLFRVISDHPIYMLLDAPFHPVFVVDRPKEDGTT